MIPSDRSTTLDSRRDTDSSFDPQVGRDAIVGVVLSVAKLTPGQEGYYERSVAAGLDDYYAGRGESPGVWTGRGARELELEGVVHDGELGRLIRGIHPRTEGELRRHPKARQI